MAERGDLIRSNPGVQSWMAGANTTQLGAGDPVFHNNNGRSVVTHGSGMVEIHPDPNGSTAWFADVLEAGRPGGERSWGR
ncbi:MAG: hypothetical protein AAF467_24635 [Actinomycetota bacterium]